MLAADDEDELGDSHPAPIDAPIPSNTASGWKGVSKAGRVTVWKARVTVNGKEESLSTALEREVTLDRGKVRAPMSSLRCIQSLNLSCAHATHRCAVEIVGPDVADVPQIGASCTTRPPKRPRRRSRADAQLVSAESVSDPRALAHHLLATHPEGGGHAACCFDGGREGGAAAMAPRLFK